MQTDRPTMQKFLAEMKPQGKRIKGGPHFCFSCEKMFPNRLCFEEHTCPAAKFICSCGTEFSSYVDMLEHNYTHEPGHKRLDHKTILKHRTEMHIEEEEKLRRLKSAEPGRCTVPKLYSLPEHSLPMGSNPGVPIESLPLLQTSVQSAPTSQVPKKPLLIQGSHLPNSVSPATRVNNLFTSSCPPTVDLWTIYRPVVVMETQRQYDKTKRYNCFKCEQNFSTKSSLILHHNTHNKDGVFGCIGCGMLLCGKKSVPRYHQCNVPTASLKTGLITAQPISGRTLIKSDAKKNPHSSSSSFGLSPVFQGSPQSVKQDQQPVTLTKELLLNTPTASKSKEWKKPIQPISVPNKPMCRVCRLTFSDVKLLQKHKCLKAHEFMQQRELWDKPSRRDRKLKKGPYPTPITNGDQKPGFPAFDNSKTYKPKAVVSEGKQEAHSVGVKRDMTFDEDCYIDECSPAQPAQIIYQVSTSLPVVEI